MAFNYSLSLDLTGGKDPNGYFPINAISVEPFKQQQIDGMVTTRYAWGTITIKNEPYPYAQLGGDRYKLFTIIKSIKPDQEIHLWFDSPQLSIKSYFGVIDAKIDNDNKVITLTVTTLDQYTAFIESRDTEIELYKEANLIANGDFKDGVNNAPNSWTFDNWTKTSQLQFLEKKYANDSSVIAISDYPINEIAAWSAYTNSPELVDGVGTIGDAYHCVYGGTFNGDVYTTNDRIIYNGTHWIKSGDWEEGGTTAIPDELRNSYIYQIVNNVLKDRQIKIGFRYGLAGDVSDTYTLKYRVTLFDPHNPLVKYGLLSDGNTLKWSAPLEVFDVINPIVYTPIPINTFPIGSVPLGSYSKTIDSPPITGSIRIDFLRLDSDVLEDDVKLVLTDIQLTASAIELKTVAIGLSADNLVTVPQGTKNPDSDAIYWSGKKPVDAYFQRTPSDQRVIADYFSVDGDPLKNAHLNDSNGYGLTSDKSTNLTYADINAMFADRNSKSHLFELSELTVYKGEYKNGNNRKWYATAKFSREERRTKDIIVNNVAIPQSPAVGVGWVDSGRVEGGSRLWIRKPFNDISTPITWTVGEVDLGDFRESDFGFKYFDKQTTKKNYPTSSFIDINNAIDLRELFKKLYCGTDKALIGKTVKSAFLWNDSHGTEIDTKIGLTSGINYVTNTENELNRILAIHTSDLRSEIKDDDNSILKTSAKKFMDDFMVLFPQTYWFIDLNGDLWIEHLKFFDKVNSAVSLLEPKYSYLKNYHSWEYVKDKMFGNEQYNTVNSGYEDFKSSTVTFTKIATNNRNEDVKATYATQILTTDIQYCCENSNSLDNGIVLVCYNVKNGKNIVSTGTGQKSGKSTVNGQLSIATLLAKYATYEGTWYEGKINDTAYTFQNTRRTRKGAEITLKGILTNDIAITDLGIGHGIKTLDFNTQSTKITALYRYEDKFISLGDTVVDMGEPPIVAPLIPTVSLDVAKITGELIGDKYAMLVGTLLSDGGATTNYNYGFYFSDQPNPVETGYQIPSSDSTMSFNEIVEAEFMLSYTTYFVCAYATNSVGTGYSTVKTFNSGNLTI